MCYLSHYLLALPNFFFSYNVALAKPSTFYEDTFCSFSGFDISSISIISKKEMKGRSVCSQALTMERQEGRRRRWGQGDSQARLSTAPSAACVGPGSKSNHLGVSHWGVSITLPAGDYFSQHQPPPSFPTEHFCSTTQDASSRKLDKDYHPGLCFCPSFSRLTERQAATNFLLVSHFCHRFIVPYPFCW